VVAAPRRRPPPARFQPRFTLMALYFVALLFVYCFAITAPVVAEFFQLASAGNAGAPEQAQLTQAMRQALRGRLWIAGLAAFATLALGIWARVVPGLRPPR
jgi:ABC-type Fe3+ transport system permease subunit